MNLIDITHASDNTEEVQTTAEHTTTPADEGLLASLGINGQMFTFQIINFAVVMVVVWYLILKPITKKMGEREKIIDESIANAKRVDENLRRSERDYQTRIDEAKVEANKVLEKAGNEAGQIGETMKEKAKKEIEGLVETAKRNIKTEKDTMVAQLKIETVDLVASALEKMLGEKIDEKKDKKIIEEMVSKLK